jgi:hypothetical protein
VSIVVRLDQQHVHDLLATPPDEFVATRNALVKRLKAEGEREQAAEAAAMRRPAWVDWALNVAAAEHAADVERFADAAEAMRAEQRAAVTGRGGGELRTAMTGLRDRTGELARLANAVLTGHGRPAALADITERLAEVATSDTSTEQLRAGLLLGEAGDDGEFAFGGVDATTENTAETSPRRKPKPKPKSNPAPTDGPDLTLERRRLERELATAERVGHAAAREAERTDTAVRHAQTAVDAATDAVTKAQSSLERAQRRLQREEAARDSAREKAAAAAAEVARLRRSLDTGG